MEKTCFPTTTGWPANKTFDKPTGDDETKRSVGHKGRHRDETSKPNLDDETYHTFVALGEGRPFPQDLSRHSSCLRVGRFHAWVNRFIQNCQKKQINSISGELTFDELKKAEIQNIQQTQSSESHLSYLSDSTS